MAEAASELDRRFMAAAIRLGAGALGTTWPNPAVGAIVVAGGRVVGRGRTAPGGRPHAETLALAEAGAAARGATMYVSLEPCSHHGRTPPCADAVVAAGIARVVAPLADPDPRVGGQGFHRLRAAAIQVDVGVLARDGGRAQAGHSSRVGRTRPHVALKLAVSADDAIGRLGEAQVAITGPQAKRHAHALRSRFDAILVGSGTVLADDPLLTCRLPGLEHRSPVRVILDSAGRLPNERRVFADGLASTWLFRADDPGEERTSRGRFGHSSPGTGEADSRERAGEGRQSRILEVSRTPAGGIDLPACLAKLAEEGITRLLVEGGARTARSFLEQELVDEAIIFRSPHPVGGGAVPGLAGLPLAAIEASTKFRRVERRMFGADRMSRYETVG